MTFFLVLLILSAAGPAQAQFSVPYTSQAACQAAVTQLNQGLAPGGNAAWLCEQGATK